MKCSRPYYSRKCSLTNIDSLPDELLFNILLHLPAGDIYKGARLVCKKWYNMVHTRNFRYTHLHNSTSGLIIHSSGDEYPVFLTMQNGQVEISKLNYKIPGIVWTSCNGLILDYTVMSRRVTLFTLNPATGRCFNLPLFIGRYHMNYDYSGIAYVAASMEYKVVHSCFCEYGNSYAMQCAITTVGVDNSWRHVDSKHLSPEARKLFVGIPFTTEGYFHWCKSKGTRVLTLNAETEILRDTPVPHGYGERTKYYLSTGSSLTLLIACSEFSWEVMKMNPETGEWTNMAKIDLEARKCKFERFVSECCGPLIQPSSLILKPVGWLNEEVLVLNASPTRVCVLYIVSTQEIDFFELDFDDEDLYFQVHKTRI